VALAAEPKTLVAARNPRSARGLHEFSSEGDYGAPDPSDANAPYVQPDGLTNPDNFVAHRQLRPAFVRHFGVLAAADRVTGDERYAAAAVELLRAGLVDPATKMNPHRLSSQAIKGRSTGRSIGVIDPVHLAEVALGTEALRSSQRSRPPKTPPSPAGSATASRGFARTPAASTRAPRRTTTAPTGHSKPRVSPASAAIGPCSRSAANASPPSTSPHPMAADGSFPQELARTKPFGYSLFHLDVMTGLAAALSTKDDNLLTFAPAEGRSLV
jgi:hypothetical protein